VVFTPSALSAIISSAIEDSSVEASFVEAVSDRSAGLFIVVADTRHKISRTVRLIKRMIDFLLI
jgi:hypothetical protein